MAIVNDYYAILQVHFLAEPEVIESAYKRLAKKYHPDVNKLAGSDARMKELNEAYETLRDAARRRAYDAQRMRTQFGQQAAPGVKTAPKRDAGFVVPIGARNALTAYFSCIKDRDFESAYGLITEMDKKNIPPEDFIKWQSGVARIYTLQGYSCKAEKLLLNCRLNGCVYSQAAEFSVTTTEHNSVMGRLEKDTIIKKVVFEDGGWRIYVGFDDIRPYIARFEELSGLLAAKSVLSDMAEHYSTRDSSTGLYNKKGFSEAAQREVWRYNRYRNAFSVMLLEIEPARDAARGKNQELLRHTVEWAGKILGGNFRKIDILGRWGETGFIVLLPETKLAACVRAAKKIKKIFEENPLTIGRRVYKVRLNIGIEEFRGALEDTIRNLNNYISIAGRTKGGSIVCARGIFE